MNGWSSKAMTSIIFSVIFYTSAVVCELFLSDCTDGVDVLSGTFASFVVFCILIGMSQ